MLYALAACHSLTKYDGTLTGDPLDVKMFASTQWVYKNNSVKKLYMF